MLSWNGAWSTSRTGILGCAEVPGGQGCAMHTGGQGVPASFGSPGADAAVAPGGREVSGCPLRNGRGPWVPSNKGPLPGAAWGAPASASKHKKSMSAGRSSNRKWGALPGRGLHPP